jgi:hypothetical protein
MSTDPKSHVHKKRTNPLDIQANKEDNVIELLHDFLHKEYAFFDKLKLKSFVFSQIDKEDPRIAFYIEKDFEF